MPDEHFGADGDSDEGDIFSDFVIKVSRSRFIGTNPTDLSPRYIGTIRMSLSTQSDSESDISPTRSPLCLTRSSELTKTAMKGISSVANKVGRNSILLYTKDSLRHQCRPRNAGVMIWTKS